MKEFFKELLEYTCTFNDKVIESLSGSTPPEKALLLVNHTLNAHEIWNARIEGIPLTLEVWELRRTDRLKAINKANYDNSLRIIDENDFEKIVRYTNTKGQTFENSVRDILFHVVNHSTYHRGQVTTHSKAHGMTPLITDYIFYKREEL